MQPLQFDLFCRVVDNFGDVGVCWRLAADLAARGQRVRLWVDDASALAWMAPSGAAGVTVLDWVGAGGADAERGRAPANGPNPIVQEALGDVVIEAFGCDPPSAFVQRMALSPKPPVWINLEYLSAEAYVERSHGLLSPVQAGPGAGLAKWFFYPGFSARTGGLIREAALQERQRAFDAVAWLSSRGVERSPGERVVSLFCYEQPALPAWLDAWAAAPTLLLATAGHAARQVEALLGPALRRGSLRALLLPHLAQHDYDHLLWASDLNFVRGEDSFIRAQWAGVPFVWQIYPQRDAAHLAKLAAFLDRFLAGAPAGLAPAVRHAWAGWNGELARPPLLPAGEAWRARCAAWRDGLAAQADLATRLLGFVAERL